MTTNLSSDNHSPNPSPAERINPYAPSVLQDPGAPGVRSPQSGHVSTLALMLHTMSSVTLSGGIFGIGVTLIGNIHVAIVIAGGIAGCFLAFLSSLAIVPTLAAGNLLIRTPGEPWTATRIQLFGALSGFLGGYVWIPFFTGFSPWSILIGLVPGAVGAIGATILLIPLARRAKRAWQRIPEIDGGPPDGFADRAWNASGS